MTAKPMIRAARGCGGCDPSRDHDGEAICCLASSAIWRCDPSRDHDGSSTANLVSSSAMCCDPSRDHDGADRLTLHPHMEELRSLQGS